MAQAARLNLRMQKELKLLLTDPPPGATFPLLSPDSDSSSFSLSFIHAQIQGPEGTVYEKGTFKINIQIPERYPFQPPIVTFATPIYHPNIDNGGRICLDILNLPPKGAWQPSLNISTVLTSIGLLLSEPNPDDGLMCEASKEYKYNRQAFDQKARSLTEKFALCDGSDNDRCSSNPNLLNHPHTSTVEVKELDSVECGVDECFVNSKKLLEMSRKFALESSGSNMKDCGKGLEVNQLGVKGQIQDLKVMCNERRQGHEKLFGTQRKLALGFIAPTQTRNHDQKENVGPHSISIVDPQSISLGTSESLPFLQSSQEGKKKSQQPQNEDLKLKPKTSISKKLCIGHKRALETSNPGHRSDGCQKNLITVPQMLTYEPVSNVAEGMPLEINAISRDEVAPQKDYVGFSNPKRKKLGLAGKRSSSGLSFPRNKDEDNKENIALIKRTVLSRTSSPFTKSSLSSKTWQTGLHCEEKSGNNIANTTDKKLPLLPLDQLEGMNECHMKVQQDHGERFARGIKESRDKLPKPEAAIVLDSDSEDERESCSRSKLSIVRKCLPGKWIAKR